jgi:hypothetical protein
MKVAASVSGNDGARQVVSLADMDVLPSCGDLLYLGPAEREQLGIPDDQREQRVVERSFAYGQPTPQHIPVWRVLLRLEHV